MPSIIRTLFNKVASVSSSEVKKANVSVSIDTNLYSCDAVQRACYWLNRLVQTHVSIDSKRYLTVTITPLNSITPMPEGIVEDFLCEVMDQELRLRVAKETNQIREIIVRRAFAINEQCVGNTISHDVDCSK